MNTSEPSTQQPTVSRKPNKLYYILITAMLAYGSVFLGLSFCHPSVGELFFVSQILNAAGFFLALLALLKANGRR